MKGLLTELALRLTLRKVDMDTGITYSTRQRLKEAVPMAESEKNLLVSLNFYVGGTKSTQLQSSITDVVNALKAVGFNVIATVCD